MPGILYIVATPIGNLEDITLRAIRVLKEADLIAAEDTRHTRNLLNRYGIQTSLTSYHDHNKEEKAPVLVAQLIEGKHIALVSDAGTPGISDPGYFLINLALDQGISIVPVPGATAATASLSISGLPTDRFVFEGFLSAKQNARIKRLKELAPEDRTLIFYEAPHKIVKMLEDMITIFGDRRAVVTRELTKMHEQVLRGFLSNILDQLKRHTVKGELTIIVHGASQEPQKPDIDTAEYLKNLILHGLSKKEAITVASKELGISKKEVYKKSLSIKTGATDPEKA